MKQTFYLVRHGQKVGVPGDPPLTEKGKQQAIKTARHLSAFPIIHIVSSPLLRTQETAKHISDVLNLEFIADPLLIERANWDDPDMSESEFLKIWTQASDDRDWQPPVGDSSYAAGKRIEKMMENLSTTDHSHIVLVTHGGIIADFVRNIAEDDLLLLKKSDFYTYNGGHIEECSITIVEKEGRELNIACLGTTDHLEEI